jgi:hypothetical protein
MLDHLIPAPRRLDLYACHQLVESLTDGARPLFAVTGDGLLIRSEAPITPEPKPVRAAPMGAVLTFELDASCYIKTRGKRRYLQPSRHAARREWLDRKAQSAGFRVLVVNSEAKQTRVKEALIDHTHFLGVLQVTDEAAFAETLRQGLPGAGARCFGFGLLRI